VLELLVRVWRRRRSEVSTVYSARFIAQVVQAGSPVTLPPVPSGHRWVVRTATVVTTGGTGVRGIMRLAQGNISAWDAVLPTGTNYASFQGYFVINEGEQLRFDAVGQAANFTASGYDLLI
jgi:hypothetical protein